MDIRNLPAGASAAMTMEQINEIVRGATIKQIRPRKAIDSDHGGECLAIELQGGDVLILIAVPGSHLAINGPTARIQPLLALKRGTRLKGLPT